ncbi:hypothetical protein T8K17_18245 [Thalassobaculum sp. OXR-137]|uniref:EF-hand domain-containing protein n=1 Tax=Thalassobaculum sp. OXR-137 TaxID=3100173 RepID=UPI002AC9140B|nr:hypothetical protein [Thalassobaculum sp. OXR-137]WPZ33171.1 hypothetical protein T8K17_18245 [Thalassobaculum sp. OXR-137]
MTTRIKALALAAALGTAVIAPTFAHAAADGQKGPDLARMQERMMQRFNEIDTDKDGKVNAADLRAYRVAKFTAADANGDGKLSVDELKTMGFAKKREVNLERMVAWFDTDGDGMIGASELPAREAGLFMMLDRDGDGIVTAEDVMSAKPPHHGAPKK